MKSKFTCTLILVLKILITKIHSLYKKLRRKRERRIYLVSTTDEVKVMSVEELGDDI